jgi:diacylglycerol kinase family enzyme
MRAVLLVNPQASGVSAAVVAQVREALPPHSEVVETAGQGDATALARRYEADADAIYVLSGDGTYNEVVNGVTGAVPLGFLPGGGTSVLPRALGLGRDPVAAARLVAAGARRPLGLGRVNGRRFTFNAGIGLDAELVRRIDSRGRRDDGRRPGDLAFAAEALRLLVERRARFRDALTVDGAGTAAFALIANCEPYTYLGRLPLRVAPEASFDAGLSLVAASDVRGRDVPRLALAAVRGAQPRPGLLVLGDRSRIVVHCDRPMPLQADGEDLGDVEEAVFESEPAAVTALVPAASD